MKINKSYLEQIIKEELQNIMNEATTDPEAKHARKLATWALSLGLDQASVAALQNGRYAPKELDWTRLNIKQREAGKALFIAGKKAREKREAAWAESERAQRAKYDQEYDQAHEPTSSIDPDAAAKERDQEEYQRQDIEKTAKDAFSNHLKGPEQPAKKKRSWNQTIARKGRIQQKLLKKMNISMEEIQKTVDTKPTGRYDNSTYRAIRNFQKKMFPKSRKEWDGLFGLNTLKAVAPNVAARKGFDSAAAKATRTAAAKKPTAVAKSTGIKSIEQLKKELAAAQSQANMTHKGGSSKSVKAAAMKDWHAARKALQLAQAQELKGKQQGIALARGETRAERDRAIAKTRGLTRRRK
jgi:peptidoglycan hydrolase-like protein with peptidoglycan-binding domain